METTERLFVDDGTSGIKEHVCGPAVVSTVGRGDLAAFFTKSQLFEGAGWRHHQALAFIVFGPAVQVRICSSPMEVLRLPDETRIMQQWPGKYDSDWFTYSVGDLRRFWEEDRL